MSCEKLEKCPFYQKKIPIDSGLGCVYRKKYCESEYSKCARYTVSKSIGDEHVPFDLYPNMIQGANQIIREKANLLTKDEAL